MDSFLRSNNLARFIAFVLAVMLWLVVRAGDQTTDVTPQIDRITETITGTAEVLVAKDRVSLVGETPEVTIQIRGERLPVWQAKMQANNLKFIVDARNLGEGVHEIPVQVQGLPPGVSFVPQNVAVRLEANLRQVIKVDLVMEGAQDPARLAQIRMNPREVTIMGPSSQLQQVQKVQARVPVQVLETPGTEHTVVVYALNDKGKTVNITIHPKTIDVAYIPAIQQKTFAGLRPEVKGLAPGTKAVLPAEGVTVTVEGPPADVAVLKPEEIRIVVDVTGLPPGDHVRDAAVTIPAAVKLVQKEPLRIPVRIETEKAAETRPDAPQTNRQNPPENKET
ncbi:CdaR family protein [Effusibacillus lacus]|uniref:YbbR family protein n=1 Tax=Effusibacillus lacus TaxID=1348429 RepID=A0A292YIU7_9BACL|nr:hypothetical protein [Effusibacillus lacus]TCS68533.1 YbbR domain-containing protein [Effusibacillus lacus]GAX88415.1 hypothetical protein EFBL_0024 [Effusibacillus lacus]